MQAFSGHQMLLESIEYEQLPFWKDDILLFYLQYMVICVVLEPLRMYVVLQFS